MSSATHKQRRGPAAATVVYEPQRHQQQPQRGPAEATSFTIQQLSGAPWLFDAGPGGAAAARVDAAAESGHFLSAGLVRQIASEVDPALRLSPETCEEILSFVDQHLQKLLEASVLSAKRRSREEYAAVSPDGDAHLSGPRVPVVVTADDIHREAARAFPSVFQA